MNRIPVTLRDNWQQKVEKEGLTFHSPATMSPLAADDHRFSAPSGASVTRQPYWDESAAYQFTAAEVDTLESAANELQQMCLAAAQNVIDNRRYAEIAIPAEAIPAIEQAWNAEPPALYGRFDISWAGAQSGQPPKLLEYNADTPTSLLEAAVIQWTWLQDSSFNLELAARAKPDQFNSIHDRLIAKWKDIQPYLTEPVYFAALEFPDPDPAVAKDAAEDLLTVTYIRDTADQAGLQTRQLALQDIGWNPDRLCFVDTDPDENQIHSLFKLYPWEAMLAEEFGPHALESYSSGHAPMTWIEPIWKLLLSNKGILPILWQLYPNHPLLLPAFFEDHGDRGDLTAYIRKPLHSREGANISLIQPGQQAIQTPGPYGEGPFIRQAIAPPAVFPDKQGNARYPILGLWMIDQECGGLGIRESAGPITDNLSSFIPHFFT
jgi:glutathionylspermidine synthase